MKKLVVMTNEPWKHVDYLEKLCQETKCQIEAFLCSEYTIHDGIFGAEKFFEKPEVYEKIGKKFKTKIIYNNICEFEEHAEKYINSDVIILAEIEYRTDDIYIFLQKHKDAKNIICIAEYEDSILLACKEFQDFDIVAPCDIKFVDRKRMLVFPMEDESQQKLMRKIKQ